MIREFGIIFQEKTLIKLAYVKETIEFFNSIRCDLIKSLLDLIREGFVKDTLTHFGTNKLVISFLVNEIFTEESQESKSIVFYCLLDYKRRIDKYVNRVVLPILNKIYVKFEFECNIAKIFNPTQIEDFKTKVSRFLEEEVKTAEQKFGEMVFS